MTTVLQRIFSGALDLELQILNSAIEVSPVVSRERRRGNGKLFGFTTFRGGLPDVLYEAAFRRKEL